MTGPSNGWYRLRSLVVVAGNRLPDDRLNRVFAPTVLVRTDVFEPLVEQFERGEFGVVDDRKVWDKAQEKLSGPTRKEYAPRCADYYLKGLLVCGHCNRPLTPTSDKKKDGRVYRRYICPTYVRGQLTGQKGEKCKAYQISTDDADRLINTKLAEIGHGINLDTDGRVRLEAETRLLGEQADELREKVRTILDEGLTEYVNELRTVYGMDTSDLEAVMWAADIALLNPPEVSARVLVEGATTTVSVADVRTAIDGIERDRVKLATTKLAELDREHTKLTDLWLEASVGMRTRIKEKITRIEADQREWQERTRPLTDQIDAYDREIAERVGRIEEIHQRWPEMELRQKGEALRGLFRAIVLRWRAEPKDKVTRYTLLSDQTGWDFTSSQTEEAC